MSRKEHDNKNYTSGSLHPPQGAYPGPPPPPAPPLSLTTSPTILEEASPAESHEIVLQKIVQKLLDWGTLGGRAGLVISQNVPHIPQIGPKYRIHFDLKFFTKVKFNFRCGLVALNMALSVFLQHPVAVDELLEEARGRKYTNHGEMFCANNLRQLALNYLSEEKIEIITSKDLKSQDFVARAIASGNLMLVPYPFPNITTKSISISCTFQKSLFTN
jgi:hypothetical protein